LSSRRRCAARPGQPDRRFTDPRRWRPCWSSPTFFGWDVDFNTDQRPGGYFRIVFERGTEAPPASSIPAAEFTNQERPSMLSSMLSDTQASGHIFEGKSPKKEFLNHPRFCTHHLSVQHAAPTSIRRIVRPHFGVDYAAGVGTPVQATADGTVVSAGWNGASGRMVRLRHRNGYETLYLHLSGFASGFEWRPVSPPGHRVRRLVGESNRPHLTIESG
jgi:hypothetical protein